MAQRLGVELLGPVRVWADGEARTLGAPRLQGVLGVLATRHEQVVTRGELIDALWGDHPPDSAENAIHVYIRRLRHVLEPDRAHRAPGNLLVSVGSGYLLRLAAGLLDVEVFTTHREQANRLRAAGELRGAARSFDDALALVRGTPWSDVPGPFAETERARLAELLLTVTEDRADTLLALGRHVEVTADLPGLVRAHPLRERLRGLLMRALYAADRQADALAVFRDTRQLLITELGIEPCAELRRLQQRILCNDPTLDGAERSGPVPRQLPAPPRPFTGRVRELVALGKALAESDTVVISAIGGTAGIGKTWLALHWAHHNLDRFPDGQLQVNLRGFDPSEAPVPSAVAVRGFLDALGVDPATIPMDPDAQVALYRSLVAGKRMLIVLDNARDSIQAAPLLPGGRTCTVLVTSRRRLGGLVTGHGAIPFDLDLLDEPEARELLITQLGHDRVAAEPDAVADLLDRCAGLPLALSIAAARAAAHPDFPLAVLAGELCDASSRLDVLNAGDLSANLRAVFSCSYDALSVAAAGVFGLLGLAPGPDISLLAAASLTGLAATRVHLSLRELEDASLVQQHLPGRYRMHDLIRLYAIERADRDHAAAALRRLVDFYLHTAHGGERVLDPQRFAIELDKPAEGVVPQRFEDDAAALDWFTTEHACLLAAHKLAVREGWHSTVWQLAWSLDTFHWRQGHLEHHVAAWHAGFAAACRLAAPDIQALAHRWLGHAYSRASRHPEALDHLRNALRLYEQTGDVSGQAHTQHALAQAWEQQGDDEQALIHATLALRLHQSRDNPVWEAKALNAVGWFHARLHHHEDALAHCQRALSLFRQHNDRDGEANTLDSLGYIAHHTGQHADALLYYRQALSLLRDLGDAYEEADTLDQIGETHHALGDHDAACNAWQQARVRYRAQHRLDDAARVQTKLAALD